MHSNPLIIKPYISLIFCYFLSVVMLSACAESKADKTEITTQKASEIESSNTSEDTTTANSTIVLFGDSITAGYGLDNIDDAYPGILQEKIDSLGYDYTVVNSGVSGETSAGGKSRISWIMKQNVDIFLLELGANDGLRGLPLSETKSNLQYIIDTVKEKSPDTQIILAGMQLPPNMGQEYTNEFQQLYVDLAESNNVTFIPFILENVGGIEDLNQADGIHPTEEGHQIVANTVWEVLQPMLEK